MTTEDRDKFIILQNDMEYTKSKVDKIAKDSEKLNKDFDKLMYHLLGDKDTNTKGWIEKMLGLDVRLTRLERILLTVSFIFTSTIVYVSFVLDLSKLFKQ
jgi:hypothetical protein